MILKIEWQNQTTTFISNPEINLSKQIYTNSDNKKITGYLFFRNNPNAIDALVYSSEEYNESYPTYDFNKNVEIPKGYYSVDLFDGDEREFKNYLLGYIETQKDSNKAEWVWKSPTIMEIRGKKFDKNNIKEILLKRKISELDMPIFNVGTAYLLNDNGKTIEIFR